MKLSLDNCHAALLRHGGSDMVYFFPEPSEICAGSPHEWGALEEKLRSKMRCGAVDRFHPPGAAVGFFRYDGSYRFAFCDHLEAAPADELLPVDVTGRWNGVAAEIHSDTGKEDYASMVRRIQEYIRAGDVYQANLARRFTVSSEGISNPRELFRHLWHVTGAPMAAMVPDGDGWLLSASPELFLEIQGRQIRTRPIKGTRPRDRDPQRDAQNAFDLSRSEKELAELIMITDLERNDLGSVCEFGSVSVPDLAKRETFSHVFHLVSTVEGQLRENVSPLQAVRACFPGGSITGAPKKRAMEIIQELEPISRGFFTGVIGYFGYDGSVQLNIAIRTIRWAPEQCEFYAGSGITEGSDPAKEFEETEHKAAAMIQAIQSCRAAAVERIP